MRSLIQYRSYPRRSTRHLFEPSVDGTRLKKCPFAVELCFITEKARGSSVSAIKERFPSASGVGGNRGTASSGFHAITSDTHLRHCGSSL